MRRQTRQKHIIESLLREADGPLLPQEILGRAQKELPTIGIATIFRTLKKMVNEGDAKTVHIPGDNPRYEYIGPSNNHHFKCSECGCVSKVEGAPVNLENLLPEGFHLAGHELILFGRCADCSMSHSLALKHQC